MTLRDVRLRRRVALRRRACPPRAASAGGIMAVLPGQLGIGVFSPRLDARGNSVRGIKVCQELSRDLDLHALQCPSAGARRRSGPATAVERVRSKRRRRERERRLLDEAGRRAQVFELQGDLVFAATEIAVRADRRRQRRASTWPSSISGASTDVELASGKLLWRSADRLREPASGSCCRILAAQGSRAVLTEGLTGRRAHGLRISTGARALRGRASSRPLRSWTQPRDRRRWRARSAARALPAASPPCRSACG